MTSPHESEAKGPVGTGSSLEKRKTFISATRVGVSDTRVTCLPLGLDRETGIVSFSSTSRKCQQAPPGVTVDSRTVRRLGRAGSPAVSHSQGNGHCVHCSQCQNNTVWAVLHRKLSLLPDRPSERFMANQGQCGACYLHCLSLRKVFEAGARVSYPCPFL